MHSIQSCLKTVFFFAFSKRLNCNWRATRPHYLLPHIFLTRCCRKSVVSTPIAIFTVPYSSYRGQHSYTKRIFNCFKRLNFRTRTQIQTFSVCTKKKLVCVKATSTKPLKRILFLSFFLLVFSFPFCAFHLCFFAFPIPFEMYTRILNKISIIIIIVQMMTKKYTRQLSRKIMFCFVVQWTYTNGTFRVMYNEHINTHTGN